MRSGAAGTVRIISGTWRSRRIEVPQGDRTRPMLDRVKAAVFDSLGSHLGTPGRLPPIVVADVFAGGGTLGLEAGSRGAAGVVFVEHDATALAALRRNLAKLRVGASGAIEAVDAWSGRLAHVLVQYRCALVFLDPPYRDAQDTASDGKIMRVLQGLRPLAAAQDEAILVLHHPADARYDFSDCRPWAVHAVRHYGTTGITFLAAKNAQGAAS